MRHLTNFYSLLSIFLLIILCQLHVPYAHAQEQSSLPDVSSFVKDAYVLSKNNFYVKKKYFYDNSVPDIKDLALNLSAGITGEADADNYFFRWKFNFAYDYSYDNKATHTTTLNIREFYGQLPVSESAILLVGKFPEIWSPNYVFKPLNMFLKNGPRLGIDDIEEETEGYTSLMYQQYFDNFTLTVIAGHDLENDDIAEDVVTGKAVGAVTASTSFGSTSVTGLVQVKEQENVAFGGYATHVFGDALELHGSLLFRNGNDRYYHEYVLNGVPEVSDLPDEKLDVNTSSLLGKNAKDKFMTTIVTGLQYSTLDNWLLIGEFVYDQYGLNSTQIKNLLQARDYVSNSDNYKPLQAQPQGDNTQQPQGDNTQQPPDPAAIAAAEAAAKEGAISQNVGDLTKTLQGYHSSIQPNDLIGQSYLFMQIQKEYNPWTVSVSDFINVQDFSQRIALSMEYNNSTYNYDIIANYITHLGSDTSELGNSPIQNAIEFLVKFRF